MPTPPAAPAEPTTCQAKSTDGHPCVLEAGHPSVERPGVILPAADRKAGIKRHQTEDGRTFAK